MSKTNRLRRAERRKDLREQELNLKSSRQYYIDRKLPIPWELDL